MRSYLSFSQITATCLLLIFTASCSTNNQSSQTLLQPDNSWTWIPCDEDDADILAEIYIRGVDLKNSSIKVPLKKQIFDGALSARDYHDRDWNYSLYDEIWDGAHKGGSRRITLHHITPLGIHIEARRSRAEETITTHLIVPFESHDYSKVGTISFKTKWTKIDAEHAPPEGHGEAPRP